MTLNDRDEQLKQELIALDKDTTPPPKYSPFNTCAISEYDKEGELKNESKTYPTLGGS